MNVRTRIFAILLMIWGMTLLHAETYRGIVKDALDGSVIESATVRLLDADSLMLGGGTTDTAGIFSVTVEEKAVWALIDYVGYETCLIYRAEGLPTDLGIITLTSNNQLANVEVTASLSERDADMVSYLVTDSLRKGTAYATQMLDKLYGVTSDWITGDITVNGEKNVLVVVNGVNKGKDYALHLNPKRIYKIQIMEHPSGRYADYDVVVNLELRSDYIGWDFSPRAIYIKPIHGYQVQPTADFTYSIDKWNLFASSTYKQVKIRDVNAYEKEYEGLSVERSTPLDELDGPNIDMLERRATFTMGADYAFNRKHSLSIQAWTKMSGYAEGTDYDVTLTDERGIRGFLQETSNNYSTNDYTLGAFYRGELFGRLNVTSDLSYNRYDITERKRFAQGKEYTSTSSYTGEKNDIRYNLNTIYSITDAWKIYADYSYNYRDYTNRKTETDEHYTSENHRNYLFANLSYRPGNHLHLRGGASLLHVKNYSSKGNDTHTSLMPYTRLYWSPWKILELYARYNCTVTHPNLDQLSPISWQMNNYMHHVGNPNLLPSVNHHVFGRVELNNWATFTYTLDYTKNDISAWYSRLSANEYEETLVNSNLTSHHFNLFGDYNFGKDEGWNLYLSGSYWLYKREASGIAMRKSRSTQAYARMSYQVKPLKLRLAAYYSIEDRHQPLLQGEKQFIFEQTGLTISRSFLDNRMPVALQIFATPHLIPHKSFSTISIDGYKSTTISDITYNSFAVKLSVRYTIGGGKVRKNNNVTTTDTEKQELNL